MSKIAHIFDRVNMGSILSNHLSTFYHYEKLQFYNKKEVPQSDKIIFGIIPVLLAILFCWSGLFFDKDYINITLTCLSIFIGLLFGLLTLVYGLVQENNKIKLEEIKPEETKKTKARIDLTVHLFINIAFSIVLSILALVFVLLTQFKPPRVISFLKEYESYDTLRTIFLWLTNSISYFLLIEFLLVLMMIIRRFMVLFLNQVGR